MDNGTLSPPDDTHVPETRQCGWHIHNYSRAKRQTQSVQFYEPLNIIIRFQQQWLCSSKAQYNKLHQNQLAKSGYKDFKVELYGV